MQRSFVPFRTSQISGKVHFFKKTFWNKQQQSTIGDTFNKNSTFFKTGRKKEATARHREDQPQDWSAPAVCAHLAEDGIRLLGVGNDLQ